MLERSLGSKQLALLLLEANRSKIMGRKSRVRREQLVNKACKTETREGWQ
jgi:hypothetical protein